MNAKPGNTPALRITVRWNRHTLALAAALVAMWYAAAAQANGAVYLLAFACAGMALVSRLHARANLRDIEIQAGDVVPDSRAACYRLPFRLIAKSKRAASGIEIAAANAKSAVFVGQLEPGLPFRSELHLPAARFIAAKPAVLLVRSLYPLGFFTAELRLSLTQNKKITPCPQGDLPLPSPVKQASASTGGSPAAGVRGVSGNDDFAGVRAWQPGDSPRHIDWKAVARERPMMTKQWTGNQDAVVILDWNSVAIPDDEKVRQFAKWIHDCEAQGIFYAVALPDLTLPAGIGPAHMRKCLAAVGEMLPFSMSEATREKRQRIPFSHETAALVSSGPLKLICAALALTLPPMSGEVSLTAMVLFLVAMAMRLAGGRLCSPLLRLAFVFTGAAIVWATETDHRTMEAATALLLVFIGAKVIESRSPRDFQVVGLLGWFLCMCDLSLEQSLGWSLYTTVVFIFLAAVLVQLRRGPGQTRLAARVASVLMAQSLPVVLLLFILFPRGTEDFVARLVRRNIGQSGLSNNLEPGSVARVALSDKVAFRAQVTGGQIIGPRDRYWRCLVLWDCNGLAWRRGYGGRSTRQPEGSNVVRQMIAVEPHGNYWLPALDRPIDVEQNASGASLGDDETVVSSGPVDNARRLVVRSSIPPVPSLLSHAQRAQALRTPSDISGRVENLAASFRKSPDSSDADVVRAALDYFREQGFKYTLDPGSYGADGLEDFLLRRRLGFCEHFSAAFATLMRLAGVPCRVVLGYLGGEYSDRGDYWIVRQYDAHAWTEVWMKDSGWTRIDPTAELNPARLTSDLETSLAGANSALALQRQTWWWQAWTESRLLWDRLDYEWYNRVVSADEQAQLDALASFGLSKVRRSVLLAALAVGAALTVLGVYLWLKRAARPPDPAVRIWLGVCNRLSKAGITRLPGEGASAFAARAAKAFPNAAASLKRISECYNELRYGHGTRTLDELRLAVRQLPPWARASRRKPTPRCRTGQ